MCTHERRYKRCEGLALALLVARVVADDHDNRVATNHLAAVTDRLHARKYLHDVLLQLVSRLAVRLRGDADRVARFGLLVAVNDATLFEVIRAEFHHYPILREDTNVMLAHLA